MRGYFGGPPAPTVVGNEGFGRVAAVGPGVTNVKVGDHVLAPNLSLTWRGRLIAPAQGLFPPPDGDRLQLAQLGSNPPTAALILSEYADLKPGDWVVQNAGNSGVGRSLIAIAKLRGIRTISLVRRPELIDELKAAGGDVVLLDEAAAIEEAVRIIGKGSVRLAVDSVGGDATATLVQLLSDCGVLVLLSGDRTADGGQRPFPHNTTLDSQRLLPARFRSCVEGPAGADRSRSSRCLRCVARPRRCGLSDAKD